MLFSRIEDSMYCTYQQSEKKFNNCELDDEHVSNSKNTNRAGEIRSSAFQLCSSQCIYFFLDLSRLSHNICPLEIFDKIHHEAKGKFLGDQSNTLSVIPKWLKEKKIYN